MHTLFDLFDLAHHLVNVCALNLCFRLSSNIFENMGHCLNFLAMLHLLLHNGDYFLTELRATFQKRLPWNFCFSLPKYIVRDSGEFMP